ncbi:hypothetical protein [Paenibacillus cellulositrophicus]|uniref:hypothetical protein n=1 Tax=Paenibacillus cellulositrophicus TaxID=562959 RepID=UPI003D959192
MKVRKILELSVDLADPVRETQLAIRAVLATLQTQEEQVFMLRKIKEDIEIALKGADTHEQSVPDTGRIQEDQ